MIITVILVRVVEAAIDEVVGVLAVRHGFMAAVFAVHVLAAIVLAVAVGWKLLIDRERVLIDVVAMRLVQMAVMEKVDVAVVDDRRVAAAGAVDVVVIFVRVSR